MKREEHSKFQDAAHVAVSKIMCKHPATILV